MEVSINPKCQHNYFMSFYAYIYYKCVLVITYNSDNISKIEIVKHYKLDYILYYIHIYIHNYICHSLFNFSNCHHNIKHHSYSV